MSQNKALTVCSLSWKIDAKSILSEISFELPQSQMLAVIGPNGAGKSSLLRAIYRFIQANSGQVMLFGEDVSKMSLRQLAKQVAVVQQENNDHFISTTFDLVAMGMLPHKSWFEGHTLDDQQQVEQALTMVGLLDKANCMLSELSGGERQRALIARAIVQKPKLLILDEPTNHLDIRYQIQILTLIKKLNLTVIVSIHDLNLASAICDQILLLNHGCVVAHGTPDDVITEATIADVFGVKCQIKPHPYHQRPMVQYFYDSEATYD
ncbi:ABC transporter ATP-binding protein [Shewanella marina]|uniref:ABC transporter ATP-binding protein n=1 Tax=Shewanella marina TaxID=487319 RepID=UPI00055EEAD9|nr:ABC transporter ATP-binding protein [Shewanella marina]